MIKNITYQYIDLGYMEIMVDGDFDMKKTMLEMLLDELPKEIDKIAELSENKDFDTLAAVSHKLKSTLSFVGNDQLNQLNKDIEKVAIKEMDETASKGIVASMKKYSQLVLAEIRLELANF